MRQMARSRQCCWSLSERKDELVNLGRQDPLPGYHNQKEREACNVEEDEEGISSRGEEEKESKTEPPKPRQKLISFIDTSL